MKSALEDLVKPVVEGLGLKFWALEHLSHGRGATLKIYIDSQERAVNVEDCATVSRQLSSVLDVEDIFLNEYILEVSSPGLNRRLFTKAHFKEFEGENIRLSLRKSYEGSKRYKGILVGLEGDEVVLQTGDEQQILFPLEHIDSANLVVKI